MIDWTHHSFLGNLIFCSNQLLAQCVKRLAVRRDVAILVQPPNLLWQATNILDRDSKYKRIFGKTWRISFTAWFCENRHARRRDRAGRWDKKCWSTLTTGPWEVLSWFTRILSVSLGLSIHANQIHLMVCWVKMILSQPLRVNVKMSSEQKTQRPSSMKEDHDSSLLKLGYLCGRCRSCFQEMAMNTKKGFRPRVC